MLYIITTELDLLKESYWRNISATKVQNSGDQTRWDRYDKNRTAPAAAAPAIVSPTFMCRILVLPKVAV